MGSLVQSSRLARAFASWAWLRRVGCDTSFPVFLHTRDVTVGDDTTVGRRCEIGGSIELGDHASLGERVSSFGDVRVGRGTRLNPRCEIRGDVSIGRYCAVARDVTLQQSEHDHSSLAVQRPLYERVLETSPHGGSRGPITVGSDVWIGTDVLVTSGTEIGHGAVVAGSAVVTDDVEPYSVVAGVPAERKKYRFPESVRSRLLRLAWWEWSEAKIAANADAFRSPIDSVDDLPSE